MQGSGRGNVRVHIHALGDKSKPDQYARLYLQTCSTVYFWCWILLVLFSVSVFATVLIVVYAWDLFR